MRTAARRYPAVGCGSAAASEDRRTLSRPECPPSRARGRPRESIPPHPTTRQRSSLTEPSSVEDDLSAGRPDREPAQPRFTSHEMQLCLVGSNPLSNSVGIAAELNPCDRDRPARVVGWHSGRVVGIEWPRDEERQPFPECAFHAEQFPAKLMPVWERPGHRDRR